MIIASGHIELNTEDDMNRVLEELKRRNVEVPFYGSGKILYVVEGESERQVKIVIEKLREIEGVREVFLSYYSLDGADKGEDFEI
jgi:nitrate reductase NapAB chaperone NapD